MTIELDASLEQKFFSILGRWTSYGNSRSFSLTNYKENKHSIYENLGNNLMISKSIKTTHNSIKTTESFYKFLEDNGHLMSLSLYNFIKSNGAQGFIKNTVISAYTDDGIKVPAGMKLSRAFACFLTNPDDLETLRINFSKIYGDITMSGQLRLSIHPFDYLSMSMNEHNWSSCQRLDGEFAAGTLALMNDSVTAIAYLSGGEDRDVFGTPSAKWNSKKWRALVHIDQTKNLIIISRHYPFVSPAIETELVDLLIETFNKDYTIRKIASNSSVPDFLNLSDYVGRGRDAVNYNDLFQGGGAFTALLGPEAPKRIVIGRAVDCLACGERPIEKAEEFSCDSCSGDSFHYCENCDAEVQEEDAFFEEGGIYCPNCYYDIFQEETN